MVKLNKVKQRYIYLSPTVQAGWEDESNIQDFDQIKVLGKGAFGKVTKCVHKRSKLVYAIKEIDKRNLKENNMIEQMTNEVKIMYQLNHPNILKLYNHFEDDKNIYLVLELAPGGQMYQILWRQPGKRFSEQRAANYIQQLCLALQKCHNNNPGIIHRDIKPENILLDANNQVKLADFGWSNFLPKNNKDVRETFCGTLDYLAPEMLEIEHKHDHTVDIWSVGVLCYELLTGLSPFAPQDRQFNAEYVDLTTRQNIKNLKYKFPNDFPPLAKDLVQKILVKETNKRLSLELIMSHPWISSYVKPIASSESNFEMDRAKQIVKSVDLDEFIGQHKDKAIFSSDQIYSYSRPDSIINKDFDKQNNGPVMSQNQSQLDLSMVSTVSGTSTQGEELRQKLIKDLTEKCQKLEAQKNALSVQNDKKQMEIDILKKQLAQSQKHLDKAGSMDNQEILKQLKQAEEKYIQLKTENDFQWGKLMESEKKNRDLQAQLSFQGNSDEISKKMMEYKTLYDNTKRQLDLVQNELSMYKKQNSGTPNQLSPSPQQQFKPSTSNTTQQKKDAEIDGFLEQLKQKHIQGLNSNQQESSSKKNYF